VPERECDWAADGLGDEIRIEGGVKARHVLFNFFIFRGNKLNSIKSNSIKS
jgi:hypothetical protein